MWKRFERQPGVAHRFRLRAAATSCGIAAALGTGLLHAQSGSKDSTVSVLTRPDKTELTDQYSNVSATGGDFGIPWMWWWHRINAGWGTVRPHVAQLVAHDEETH